MNNFDTFDSRNQEPADGKIISMRDWQLKQLIQQTVKETMARVNLDNLKAEPTGMSEGETGMAKRIRQKAMIGGKLHWVTGETQQEVFENYLRKVQEAGIEIRQTAAKKETPTMRAFIEETYEPTFIRHLAPKTVDNYTQYIKLNILPFLGDKHLDEIDVTTIQQFYDWMATAASRGRKKNLNRDSITRIGGLLSRMFKVAQEMGLIDDTPMKKTLLRIRAEPAGHHRALPDEEITRIKAVIPTLENEEQRLYMALLAFTGMRPEEVYGLRWEDVHLDRSFAQVVRAVTYPKNNRPHVGPPKTDRYTRTVLLPVKVVEILKAAQKPEGFILGGDAPWCYSKKTRVSEAAFSALGIVGYTDADFRTTFGTQLEESGKTSAEVADLMGHADTRMVETVYARTRHEGVMKHLTDVEKIS